LKICNNFTLLLIIFQKILPLGHVYTD
jgi:hypothetical protein